MSMKGSLNSKNELSSKDSKARKGTSSDRAHYESVISKLFRFLEPQKRSKSPLYAGAFQLIHFFLSPVRRLPSTVYRLPFAVLFLFSCNSGPDDNKIAVQAFVEKQVEEQLATYKRIFMQQCRDKVLLEAGQIADSILITEARLKRDSMGKPPKPLKPEKPEIKQLKDSLTLDPLFRDTTNQ